MSEEKNCNLMGTKLLPMKKDPKYIFVPNSGKERPNICQSHHVISDGSKLPYDKDDAGLSRGVLFTET